MTYITVIKDMLWKKSWKHYFIFCLINDSLRIFLFPQFSKIVDKFSLFFFILFSMSKYLETFLDSSKFYFL